jgi:hypothetical protein
MATHKQIEAWWADRRCEGPHVSLNMNGRYPVRLQPELEAAGNALAEAIMTNGYRSPMGATGSYNCRKIGGSDTWSLHAYGVAIDWDYGVNPYLRGTKIEPGFKNDYRFELTEWQVNAVEAIKNDDGASIWRWLGWTIGDTMHFQVDVPPDKCQPASTVTPPVTPPTEDYMYIPVEYTDGFNSNPAKRAAVAGFQGALKIKGFADSNSQSVDGVDGKYGNGTIAACKAFQKSVGFKVTGIGDIKTRAKAEE